MRVGYHTCDVFTETRFGGNPLAVIPEAEGLDADQMQRIAREFNYSETTFVLPPEAGHTRRVRIFTPAQEVPFAGHPNVGTAFVLARRGDFGALEGDHRVAFEEGAGVVPVTIEARGGRVLRCEVEAPVLLELGAAPPVAAVAESLSLGTEEIVCDTHPPQVASVGLPLLFVEVRDRDALARVRIDEPALRRMAADLPNDFVHAYARSRGEFDAHVRMFAASAGVPEDPATGSANCTLGGLLAHCNAATEGTFAFRFSQGTGLGRPSILEARAEKRGGRVAGTWIGGACVPVAEGVIEV